MTLDPFQLCLTFVVLMPGAAFALISLLWLLGWIPSERTISKTTGLLFSAALVALAIIVGKLTMGGGAVSVNFGDWFAAGHYQFPLMLTADRVSLPFLCITVTLAALIGQFSVTYLHRERGFLRFFVLLHLFAFGSLLAFAAASFDLLVAGWEMVGITSVLLIAFFDERPAPVENGLRVFAIYRACDIGLLVGVFAMHNWAGTALLSNAFTGLTKTQALIVTLLMLLAASGKAAQVPFSGWLPRAMEGPTPSSAIFYGAISIHAGAYLLLRVQPVLADSKLASASVIGIGLLTAIHGTIVGRASADAKTSLAYASLTQVGVIFVEIGIGWTGLAIAHILGHATVRTLQFLRTPSALHDYHRMHSAAEGRLAATGKHLEQLFPTRVQLWLYRWALDRAHLDTVLDRLIVYPLTQLSQRFARMDDLTFRPAPTAAEEQALAVGPRIELGSH